MGTKDCFHYSAVGLWTSFWRVLLQNLMQFLELSKTLCWFSQNLEPRKISPAKGRSSTEWETRKLHCPKPMSSYHRIRGILGRIPLYQTATKQRCAVVLPPDLTGAVWQCVSQTEIWFLVFGGFFFLFFFPYLNKLLLSLISLQAVIGVWFSSCFLSSLPNKSSSHF